MANVGQEYHLKTQPIRNLHFMRVNDGWIVYLAGTRYTNHSTYLYLYDTGKVQRVTEGPAFVDMVTFNGEIQ